MAIDRQTHDSDVMERVLGVDNHPDSNSARTEVIDFAAQPLLSGVLVATVQLTSGSVRPQRTRHKPRR